jgi:hypothetical protein
VDRRSHPRIERKYIPEASFFWAGGSLIRGPEFVPWEGKRRGTCREKIGPHALVAVVPVVLNRPGPGGGEKMITSASRRFLLASIKSFSPGGTGFFLPFDEKLEVHTRAQRGRWR